MKPQKLRWSLHLLRGALGILMLASFAYGLRTLQMSEAYAIFSIAPLLITALGVRVGANRWIAILIGLVGVIVILRPSGAGMWARRARQRQMPHQALPSMRSTGGDMDGCRSQLATR